MMVRRGQLHAVRQLRPELISFALSGLKGGANGDLGRAILRRWSRVVAWGCWSIGGESCLMEC